MSRKINVPEGYTTWLFASDKNALVASNGQGKNAVEVRRAEDVLVPFPLPGHVDKACEGLEFVLTDQDGEEHTYTGPEAAVAQRYTHAAEYLRGMLRARRKGSDQFKYTDEQVLRFAESFTKISGRGTAGVSAQDAEKRAYAETLARANAMPKPKDAAEAQKQLEELKAFLAAQA